MTLTIPELTEGFVVHIRTDPVSTHGDAIWSGEIDAKRWLQIGLTTMVPYCVSTASSVMAARQAQVQAETGSEVD